MLFGKIRNIFIQKAMYKKIIFGSYYLDETIVDIFFCVYHTSKRGAIQKQTRALLKIETTYARL